MTGVGRAELAAELAAGMERVARGLEPVTALLADLGMPAPAWEGKLIRPLVALAGSNSGSGSGSGSGPAREGAWPTASDPLWAALGALQLAHEASLLHDDVLDGADERRGVATVRASRGVAAALVEGDHLLTSAYRLAARTGSPAWVERFAYAVERTVAGEIAQARAAGRALDWAEYEAIVLGKSGELIGAALSVAATLRDDPAAARYYEAGRRLGLVYQMLDDLLDYCPHVDTGKPSLADYTAGLWTWPRLYVELPEGAEPAEAARRLLEPDATGVAPIERCVVRLEEEARAVRALIVELLPEDRLLTALMDSWLDRARAALDPVANRPRVELPPVAGWEGLMAERAKSFRFASRLFPRDQRRAVLAVYAWCRYTDDLVDGVDLPPDVLEARLDEWLRVSSDAYAGRPTGNSLADQVMADMRTGGVPFGYAAALVEGMRMDVRGTTYGTVAELRTYTFRVASVVGLWVTELFGVRDPWMLNRAAALGHAMQLTNILRDVGEDLRAGRLYLPGAWLTAHDLTRADLERMMATGAIEDRYAALTERLLRAAEAEYEAAAPAIARLPDALRLPVAVAADVYRGIHEGIRASGYDNLTRRAHTSLADKVRLGASALWRARSGRDQPSRSATAPRAALFALAALAAAGPLRGQEPASARDAQVRPPAAAPAASPATLTPGTSISDPPAGEAVPRIRQLWLRAVDDPEFVAAGLAAVTEARVSLSETPQADGASARVQAAADRPSQRLLDAYEGGLLALRARHGRWPPRRLADLRAGLALLDTVVAADPDAAEPRYVRLMSGFHLPAVFGRRDVVEEDRRVLTRLLSVRPDALPADLLPGARAFLREHGDGPPDRAEAGT